MNAGPPTATVTFRVSITASLYEGSRHGWVCDKNSDLHVSEKIGCGRFFSFMRNVRFARNVYSVREAAPHMYPSYTRQ